jgi:hypothetical protein
MEEIIRRYEIRTKAGPAVGVPSLLAPDDGEGLGP